MTKQLKAPSVTITYTAEEFQDLHRCLDDIQNYSPKISYEIWDPMLKKAKRVQESDSTFSKYMYFIHQFLHKHRGTIDDSLELENYQRMVSGVEGHLEIALDPEEIDDHTPRNIADLKDELEEKIIQHNDFVKQLINKQEEN
tara:strand:+ start:475 stop:900 length:426 start_codon:yes stop_codon:yes gene_type:complete